MGSNPKKSVSVEKNANLWWVTKENNDMYSTVAEIDTRQLAKATKILVRRG